jgi:hypothetical protein
MDLPPLGFVFLNIVYRWAIYTYLQFFLTYDLIAKYLFVLIMEYTSILL